MSYDSDALRQLYVAIEPTIRNTVDFGRMYWMQLFGLSLLLLPFANYWSIVVLNWLRINSSKDGRHPPVIPYYFPLIGSLLSIARDPFGFLQRHKDLFPETVPIGVKMGPLRSYLISNVELFMTLTKTTQHLTPKPAIAVAMENIFGTPARAIQIYKQDDSGIGPKPLSGTKVPPNNRIWYNHSAAARTYLSGKSLQLIGERFMDLLAHDVANDTSIGKEWVERPDIYVFWQDQVFEAALNALFGPHLLRLNPGFTNDFWAYIGGMSTLMMGLPRWMSSTSWNQRQKVLESIKVWQRYALTHSKPFEIEDEKDWDEYWGSAYLKARYRFRAPLPAFDEDAHAADDLALMVAANANAIISSVWFLLETLLDPSLPPRLQREIEISRRSPEDSGESRFDIPTLLSQPLLQSIYAETLRLRMGLLINRTSQQKEVRMGPWKFPPNAPIGISTTQAATNPQIWSDANGERPIDKFWADRFMVYSDDPASGPLRDPAKRSAEKSPESNRTPADPRAPQFSLHGLGGGWIPYGAGEFMCPGRHLAKQEMIGSFAIFLANYEVQLKVPDGWVPKSDTSFFATGTLPPLGQIPFRIRRRSIR